ncbi:DgyrCDS4865 [Dimorphilus gyrociliatus]|uniref:Phosphate transporter n=1 Tax=Dimorphilus gyrociliatus TaxID=2664684 RepID=A0A7I8VI82_9ANNE|nr:DgyrCDS4865 [Dimorphilus gyrociliatus]
MVSIDSDQLWMVIVGFLIAFALAFGIGANDVANSFGTSVGSGVITLKVACILASIFETLGAVLLGAKVSDTIRKGIIEVTPYQNDTSLFMVGNVAALSGSCLWLLAATLLRMPVSATHSIVGATIGFALVGHGASGINWSKLGLIIGSWFISPIVSGAVSTGLFFFCKHFILNKADPLEPGLKFLPVFYGLTIVINFFSVSYNGPKILGFDKIPLWGVFIISFGGGIITAILVLFAIVPWQRRKIRKQCDDPEYCPGSPIEKKDNSIKFEFGQLVDNSTANSKNNSPLTQQRELQHINLANFQTTKIVNGVNNKNNDLNKKPGHNKAENALLVDNEYNPGTQTPAGVSRSETRTDLTYNIEHKPNGVKPPLSLEDPEASGRSVVKDRPETGELFSFLQILTAIFGSFAHGGNDVSNAIGPLVSLWLVGTRGEVFEKAATPVWILFYGGVGISIGLWVWGRRVIKTLGEDLTKITPSSGFCIEIGSALSVLIASNIGIPISTTHCKVGSVVFVGRFRSKQNVDWKIFRNIIFAWLVTLPISGGISAAIMAALKMTL